MATSVLPNQQCIFGAERCAHGQVIVDKERPDHSVVSTTDATFAAVDSLTRSERGVLW